MRIAQLANFIGPASGGMKHAVDALGRGYVEAGMERLLVIPGPVDAVTSTESGDVVQVRAPRVGSGYRLIVEPWRVADILERYRPTSIELSDKLTLLPVARWARARDVGTVLISHERLDDMFALRVGGRTGLDTSAKASIKVLNRLLVRSVEVIVVTSRYAEAEFREVARNAGCPVRRIPLGVDLDAFRPHTSPASDGVLKLAHVGRLSREKSPHLAVATAVELHRRGHAVSLDVYGVGPHLDELVELAAGAPVRFRGFVDSRVELSRAVASADVSLSVCPGETFGLAVLEALASGTPVVTADRGGARELVDATSGAWGTPDPATLADAVLEVARRPQSRSRGAARRRAEQYPWSRAVEQMLDVHAQIAERRLTFTA